MAWCFSTRASVATILSTHPCISSCYTPPLVLLYPGRCDWFKMCTFKTKLGDWYHEYLSKHYPGMNAKWFCWWKINIVSGSGLVPSGNNLGRYWPRSQMPYAWCGVTWPQWVKFPRQCQWQLQLECFEMFIYLNQNAFNMFVISYG